MNTPNTKKLPVKIPVRTVSVSKFNSRTFMVHPGLKKRWNPPVVGYVCRVFGEQVQVVHSVHRALWYDDPFFFAMTNPCARNCRVIPIDATDLCPDEFYVSKEDAGKMPHGFLPSVSGAYQYTTVPEKFWRPFVQEAA